MRSRTVQPLKQREQGMSAGQGDYRKTGQNTRPGEEAGNTKTMFDLRESIVYEQQREEEIPEPEPDRENGQLDYDMISIAGSRREALRAGDRTVPFQIYRSREAAGKGKSLSKRRGEGQDSKQRERRFGGSSGMRYAYDQGTEAEMYTEASDPSAKGPKKGILARIFVTDGQYFDFDLLLVIIFLLCFGLVLLYSTSAYGAIEDFGDDTHYFTRQAVIGIGSFVIMLFVSRLDYHIYGAFSFELYILAMILMALVQTPLGVTINGARRWIGISESLTFQPAEITKIAVILFISYELCRLSNKAYTKAGTIRIFVFGGIAAAGVRLLTDNLSTAIIVMSITCVLYFVVHPKLKPFLAMVSGVAVLVIVLISFLATSLKDSDNFRLQRIITWLDPENHTDTGGFQVMQGLYAIGSGGFFGKGLGNSTQKLGVIPEAQNDMILTIICEELGVFGAIIIFLLFILLLYRLMFIARNAPDLYGSLVATGIFAHISLQVILNAMVVTNTIPTTGITLPFISYGGTSILFLLAEMGIALGISRKIKLKE